MNAMKKSTTRSIRVLAAAMLGATALGATAAPLPQDVLIRGAKVYTVTAHGTLDNADVLVHAGKIAAVAHGGSGALSAPQGAEIVEAKGRALTPGIFAGLSHIGLEEISAEDSTVDASLNLKAPTWDQQWRPEFDVTLAYNPRSTLIPVARVEGLTWTELMPDAGDSIIAGQGAAVTLDSDLEARSAAVLDGSRSLFVQLGSAGHALSGGSRAAQYSIASRNRRWPKMRALPGQIRANHSGSNSSMQNER